MSGEPPAAPATARDRDAGERRHGETKDPTDEGRTTPTILPDRIASGPRESTTLAAGAIALLAIAGATALRILRNLPFDPVVAGPTVTQAANAGVAIAVSLALAAAALASERPAVRTALLFAGVFGLLAAVSPAASIPAAVAVTAGGALALLGPIGRPSSYRDVRTIAVATAFAVGIGLSLGSAVGLLDAGLRALGGTVALAALAGTAVRIEGDRLALAAGVATVAAVVAASVVSPFVVGSALLAGFSVVGVPHVLAALAAGGAVGAAVAGLRRGSPAVAIGAGILLFAGVPATLPRATAVVLGAALALHRAETLVTDGGATSRGDATEVGR